MDFTKEQRSEVICKHAERENGLHDLMENFFGLMKTELSYLHERSSSDEFEKELRSYINYYNNDRIKLRLKGKKLKGKRLKGKRLKGKRLKGKSLKRKRLKGKSPVKYRTLYQ